MLRLLRVRNFALIDELTLEFDRGLNVLSGETGAGKSLIVDALGLVAGDRASADTIRRGEDRAIVEAVGNWETATVDLSPIGLDAIGSDDELILRREIASDNRNRVFINNQPATAAALRTIAAGLLDIHGQHEQQSLLDPATQLSLIDRAAGTEDIRNEVSGLYDRARALREELSRLEAEDAGRAERQELLAFQKAEIEQARPEEGETGRLRDQVRVLEHAERLLEAAGRTHESLYESDTSLLGQLSALERSLESQVANDSRLAPIVQQIEAGRNSLEEASWSLREYLNHLDIDPKQLQQLQSRLAELERLERKYGPDLVTHLDRVSEELDKIGLREDRRSSVVTQLETTEGEFQRAASALSRKRRAAAGGLSGRVTAEVQTLAMPEAIFTIEWKDLSEPRRTGIDLPVWTLAPNPGEAAAPLASIASGGELSRTMLALRSVLARDGHGQTLVFDEIDAGIGGEAAERVGLKLQELAGSYQVLCVTHLPQIARFADRHVRIDKRVNGGRTRTVVQVLSGEERVEELARMIGGKRVSKAARDHVRELLGRK